MTNPNKVYVGGLDEDTKKSDLEDFFADMGAITSVWIARQPPGFAFIEFDDERDAADACKRLNGKELLGRTVSVQISGRKPGGRRSRSPRRSRSRGRRNDRSRSRGRRGRDRSRSRGRDRGSRYSGNGPPPDTASMTTLKIGNLSRRTDQHDLRRHFEKHGEIGDVYIPLDPRSKEPRGFAFVRFYNKREAKDAEKTLDGSRLNGRMLEVQMAKYGRPDRVGETRKASRSTSRHKRSRSPKRSKSSSVSASRSRSSEGEGKKEKSQSPSPKAKDSKSKSRSPSSARGSVSAERGSPKGDESPSRSRSSSEH